MKSRSVSQQPNICRKTMVSNRRREKVLHCCASRKGGASKRRDIKREPFFGGSEIMASSFDPPRKAENNGRGRIGGRIGVFPASSSLSHPFDS